MDKLVVSPSLLDSIATCSTKAWLSKQCNLTSPGQSAALTAGGAAHAGLAHWFRTGGDAAGAKAVFESLYKEWSLQNVLSDDVRAWGNASEIFSAFVTSLSIEKFPYTYTPAEVEVHVQVPLLPDIEIQGYIDLPVRDRAVGGRYILDHKFTGWLKKDTIEGYKLSAQFKAYAWMWQTSFGERVSGAVVNAVEWSKLPVVQSLKSGAEKKCRMHGVPYSECRLRHANRQLVPLTLMPEDLEVWLRNAKWLAARFWRACDTYGKHSPLDYILQQPMEGTFSGACRWCEFNRFCAGGRQKHTASTLLVPRKEREVVVS